MEDAKLVAGGIQEREFEEYLEKDVIVFLKDGRQLWGVFKSYDQYNSLTLNFVTERIFYNEMFAEKKQGLAVIRGENIVFMGMKTDQLKEAKRVDFEYLQGLRNTERLEEIEERAKKKKAVETHN